MVISPCNNLNVKTIRFSQLAYLGFNDLKGSDIIYISQFDPTNNLYYSKKTTLTDVANFAKFANSSSYSGSFSGSFFGRVVSKNTKASGSFSGSFYGSLESKNTKASGSFSGSFYGSLESKNTKASGSFSGSFYGNATTATNALTADLATTATTANTATSATTATSAISSLTSSYLFKTAANTSNRLSYWDTTKLNSTNILYAFNQVPSVSYASSRNYLFISSSVKKSHIDLISKEEAYLGLSNFNRKTQYPNSDTWIINTQQSGSLTFVIASGSSQIKNVGLTAGSKNDEVYGIVHRRNGFYFWPYMGNQAVARDGAVGIGAFPPNSATGSANQYLRAKLQIVMFSGSNEGSFPGGCSGVEHRSTAILVQYGSGSATTVYDKTFHVSASGNTYVGGTLTVKKAITSSVSTIGSAGGDSGNYIPIKIGNTIYKIKLYNNS